MKPLTICVLVVVAVYLLYMLHPNPSSKQLHVGAADACEEQMWHNGSHDALYNVQYCEAANTY